MPHFINLIALFLGVWHSVRRLDVARHEAETYPQVEPAAFAQWRARALRAHGILVWACFAYILVDLAFRWFAVPSLAQTNELAVRIVGGGLTVVWAVATGVGMYRVRVAEALRGRLGIELGRAR